MMPVRVIRRTMRGMFLYGSRGTTVVFGAKLIAGHLFRMGIQGYIAGGDYFPIYWLSFRSMFERRDKRGTFYNLERTSSSVAPFAEASFSVRMRFNRFFTESFSRQTTPAISACDKCMCTMQQ